MKVNKANKCIILYVYPLLINWMAFIMIIEEQWYEKQRRQKEKQIKEKGNDHNL